MKNPQTTKTATAARNAVQLSKQGPYAWGVERDGKLIAQGLSKGAAEALAKTATACQKTPEYTIAMPADTLRKVMHDTESSIRWAQLAGEHAGAIQTLQGECDHLRNHAEALAEALRQIKSAMEHHFAPYDRHWCIDKAREALARSEAK